LINFLGTVTESWFWRYFFAHFGWVDWLLTAFVVVGIFMGLKHGVTGELPRLFETLIALYVTFDYYSFFAEWLARETPWPESYARAFPRLFRRPHRPRALFSFLLSDFLLFDPTPTGLHPPLLSGPVLEWPDPVSDSAQDLRLDKGAAMVSKRDGLI
jgi:hypothetical protein